MDLEIRPLRETDIEGIAQSFARLGWDKPISLYQRYMKEQVDGARLALVAFLGDRFVGYLTILWFSEYKPFQAANIPEIKDLNVLPNFRRQGIATKLMEEAEKQVRQGYQEVGLGVGLTVDYGAAQRLYALRGYVPDSRGLAYDGKSINHGEKVSVDDSLNLYLTKVLVQKRVINE